MQDNVGIEEQVEVQDTELETVAGETEPTEPENAEPSEDILGRVVRELAELRSLVEQRADREPEANSAEFRPTLTDAFCALYPDVGEGDIPDAVWDEVRSGMALEAAYALWERREFLRKSEADTVNRRNAGGAWGRADAAETDFLSPDEVRSMTPHEVRKNYAHIVESMKHWT